MKFQINLNDHIIIITIITSVHIGFKNPVESMYYYYYEIDSLAKTDVRHSNFFSLVKLVRLLHNTRFYYLDVV